MTSPAHDPADLDGFGTTAMVQCAQEWLLDNISAELFGDEAPSAAVVADWIGKFYPGGMAAFVRQHERKHDNESNHRETQATA